jgi:rhamnosyltransferase
MYENKIKMNKKIVALVTIYYPNLDVVLNMERLSQQVTMVILLDNTPLADNRLFFKEISNLQYLPNNENLGLSAAFNKGLKLDVSMQSDFIIFFDQDSQIPCGLIDSLVTDFENVARHEKIGCIGPVYHDTNANKKVLHKDKKLICDNIYSVKNIITSSMLTTYQNLDIIGFWNEEIFLDLSDWDMCWRFRESGYVVCLSLNSVLKHTLGQSIKKFAFLSIRHCQSVREYYGIRDSIKLFFKSYTPYKYKVRFVFMWTLMPIVYLIVFPKRINRLKHIARGLIDGLMRVNGEFR